MRRTGSFTIRPAQEAIHTTAMGEMAFGFMEYLPGARKSGVRFPDRDEIWLLTNLYLPFTIDSDVGVTTATVIMQIQRSDTTIAWAAVQQGLSLLSNGVLTGAIAEDFVNPIVYRFDEDPLLLFMGLALELSPANTNLYVGFTAGLTGPIELPGSCSYISVTKNEPEWNEAY